MKTVEETQMTYWIEFEDYSKLSGLTAQQVADVKKQEKNGGMKIADWGINQGNHHDKHSEIS